MIREYPLDFNSFIGAWYIDPLVCQDVMAVFNANSDQHKEGCLGNGANVRIDPLLKASTDLMVYKDPNIPQLQIYLDQLWACALAYQDRYGLLTKSMPWALTHNFNIQWYKPGQAYHSYHCERNGTSPESSTRHLVWMTYLNDVTDGGETEWLFQGIKLQPQQGLTVIWPTDWTHTHRGLPSPSQDKYIVTGWFNFT